MATVHYLFDDDREVAADQPLDLTPYPHDDEIDAPHPMRELRHSPFFAWLRDLLQDSRMRIELACGAFGLLAFVLFVGRIVFDRYLGGH